ncbi:MAG: hypothetical protein LBR05_00960 [Azoarcus sp.]|jgi:hypothetical protein|nr:hypothetical protein [Azoarcus sp.]
MQVKKFDEALFYELGLAHLIIAHAHSIMSVEQRIAWANINERAGVVCRGEGTTRIHERVHVLHVAAVELDRRVAQP